VANLPLAFGELLAGGVLLTAGVSGNSPRQVLAGTVSLKPFDVSSSSGDSTAATDATAATAGTSGGAGAGGSPLAQLGKIIGTPYQGTHTLFGNWESDNAVDISAPVGTPVYAVAAGTIGSQLGSLESGSSLLEGLRLHLVTSGNEYYYAHLSSLAVHAGQTVKEGDLLGYSGEANGVAHLHFAQKIGNPLDLIKKLGAK
jgi:murein DD-endopeptidase MepM/ murein hydrolase activator NlpD